MFRALRKPSKLASISKSLLLSTLFYGAYNQYEENKRKALTCGIIAYLGTDPIATEVILHGIKLLQNRGYDSAGIVTVSNERELVLTKLASDVTKKIDCIDKIEEIAPDIHKGAKIGMGHTRWATCGEKTDVNAHPHVDYKNRVAVIHNGTLENVDELRKELRELNIPLKSQTDTEVIPQFIGHYLDEGNSFNDAVKKTLEKIKGTWGLIIINREDPEKLVVCRNGSPIVVGFSQNGIFVSSESFALEKYTSNYIKLNEGEVVYLDVKNKQDFYKNVKERVQTIKFIDAQTKPKAPYTTFFEQEVMEQPEALMKCMNYGARLSGEPGSAKLGGFDDNKAELLGIKHLIIVACGTSYFASLYGVKIFKALGCFETVQAIVASELTEEDLPESDVGVMLISQSGETADVYRALKLAQKKGFPTIGMVNVIGSLIATSVTCGIFLNSGREVSVPATKSFTGQITAISLSALWFSHNKGIKSKLKMRTMLSSQMHSLPMSVGNVLYTVDDKCKELAEILAKEDHLYILGKGFADPIAKEAALKIKETSYIHAEAFPAGELKHGSLALFESSKDLHTKVILFVTDDEYVEDMNLTLSEMKANKAYTIVITHCMNKIAAQKVDFYIEVPALGALTSMLGILPIQKICLEIARIKDLTIDKPRNLAKTVTVQ